MTLDDLIALGLCGLAIAASWHLMRHGLRMPLSKRKILMCGDALPTGYRVAYIDALRMRQVAYPIGIHLIVMAIRRIWEETYWYEPSEREQQILDLESHRTKAADYIRRAKAAAGGHSGQDLAERIEELKAQ